VAAEESSACGRGNAVGLTSIRDGRQWCKWSLDRKTKNGGGGEFYTDSVPFSCCDVDSTSPCIHDDVLTASSRRHGYNPARTLTIYTRGCSAVVADTLQTTPVGCVLVALSLVAVSNNAALDRNIQQPDLQNI